jgi:predicted nucleic acid-binding protein
MKGADTKRFVLDASVAIAWCFEDETTKFTESVLNLLTDGAEAVVPAIWPLEVGNALLIAERRGRIVLARATALLHQIAGLPIAVSPIDASQAFEQILAVARQQSLTEYDASYLELALRKGFPLATLDAELRRSAKATGVALVAG